MANHDFVLHAITNIASSTVLTLSIIRNLKMAIQQYIQLDREQLWMLMEIQLIRIISLIHSNRLRHERKTETESIRRKRDEDRIFST